MKRLSKKYLLFIYIGILIIIIAIPTIYKIIKNYHSKSYLVVKKQIIEAAKKCYNENKCTGDKIVLKDLYDNGYLDIVINPVTKKVYDENLEIKKSKSGFSVKVN